jgi:hypothetical protein
MVYCTLQNSSWFVGSLLEQRYELIHIHHATAVHPAYVTKTFVAWYLQQLQ